MEPTDVLARTPSNSSSGAVSVLSGGEDRLKLISVLGGDTLFFDWKQDRSNADVVNIIFDIIHQCLNKFSNLKLAFKKDLDKVNKNDFETVKDVIDTFNNAAATMSKLWKGATNPEALSWSQDRADVPLLTSICSTAFNSAVSSVKSLNSHYTPFSSEVYGETKYEQMQKIIEQLKFKESDVFVDLGSGVGHLVLYVAGGTKVRKAVGIEKANVPAGYAGKMKGEFKRWMGWYNKKHRPFDLIQGDFLDPKYHKLITQEATIVFINNYAFNPDLEMRIKRELLAEMKESIRIISTKAYATGTKEINHRLLNDVESILDVRELQSVDCPTSWTDKPVPYYLHTVNRTKLENYFSERAHGKSSSQSTENSRRASVSSKSSGSSREGSTAADTTAKVSAAIPAVSTPHEADHDFDEESAYGPTTRHKWKEYVNDLDRKKRKVSPQTSSPRWNEADREYVPPGTKKPRKNAAATPAIPKVAKVPKKSVGKAAAVPRAPRLSDDARAGIDQLHSMIVSPKPVEPEGTGLVRIDLKVKVPKSESPALPDTKPAALPAGAIVLDPHNPLDKIMIEMRQGFTNYMERMATEDYHKTLADDIQRENARRVELLEKVREKEVSVQQLLSQGVTFLHSRLKDLGMSDVETPSELLTCSKRIVAQHKELTQNVSAREAEVACLEGKTRGIVPFGEVLLDKLHMVEDCPDPEKDKYLWLIQNVANETGHPIPRLESDNENVQQGEGVLSPGGPRRRPRPRNGPGRKGRSEENSEEVDRKVQEIFQAAMLVETAVKEKERKARGASTNEKPMRKSTGGSGSIDAMSVPLPRTAPFPAAALALAQTRVEPQPISDAQAAATAAAVNSLTKCARHKTMEPSTSDTPRSFRIPKRPEGSSPARGISPTKAPGCSPARLTPKPEARVKAVEPTATPTKTPPVSRTRPPQSTPMNGGVGIKRHRRPEDVAHYRDGRLHPQPIPSTSNRFQVAPLDSIMDEMTRVEKKARRDVVARDSPVRSAMPSSSFEDHLRHRELTKEALEHHAQDDKMVYEFLARDELMERLLGHKMLHGRIEQYTSMGYVRVEKPVIEQCGYLQQCYMDQLDEPMGGDPDMRSKWDQNATPQWEPLDPPEREEKPKPRGPKTPPGSPGPHTPPPPPNSVPPPPPPQMQPVPNPADISYNPQQLEEYFGPELGKILQTMEKEKMLETIKAALIPVAVQSNSDDEKPAPPPPPPAPTVLNAPPRCSRDDDSVKMELVSDCSLSPCPDDDYLAPPPPPPPMMDLGSPPPLIAPPPLPPIFSTLTRNKTPTTPPFESNALPVWPRPNDNVEPLPKKHCPPPSRALFENGGSTNVKPMPHFTPMSSNGFHPPPPAIHTTVISYGSLSGPPPSLPGPMSAPPPSMSMPPPSINMTVPPPPFPGLSSSVMTASTPDRPPPVPRMPSMAPPPSKPPTSLMSMELSKPAERVTNVFADFSSGCENWTDSRPVNVNGGLNGTSSTAAQPSYQAPPPYVAPPPVPEPVVPKPAPTNQNVTNTLLSALGLGGKPPAPPSAPVSTAQPSSSDPHVLLDRYGVPLPVPTNRQSATPAPLMSGPPPQMNGPPPQMNAPPPLMNGPPPPRQMNNLPPLMNGPSPLMGSPSMNMRPPQQSMNMGGPPRGFQMGGPMNGMNCPPPMNHGMNGSPMRMGGPPQRYGGGGDFRPMGMGRGRGGGGQQQQPYRRGGGGGRPYRP